MTREELDKACDILWDIIEPYVNTYSDCEEIQDAFCEAMNPYIDTETSKRLSEEVTREIVEQISPEYDAEYLQSKIDAFSEARRKDGKTADEMLDKACRWLVEHSYNSETSDSITLTSVFSDGPLTKAFRKAMEAVIKESLTTEL